MRNKPRDSRGLAGFVVIVVGDEQASRPDAEQPGRGSGGGISVPVHVPTTLVSDCLAGEPNSLSHSIQVRILITFSPPTRYSILISIS